MSHSNLTLARHAVGIAVVSALDPHTMAGVDGFEGWFYRVAFTLLFAGAAYGLYALFFTERAKQVWPDGLYKIAWLFCLLLLANAWWGASRPTTPAAVIQFDPSTARIVDDED